MENKGLLSQLTPAGPRALGTSDVVVSPIAWGMWRFQGALRPAIAAVEAAVEAGMTFLDTAAIYGIDTAGFGSSEVLLGQVFREVPDLRAQVVLASKGGIIPGVPYDSSPAAMMASLDESLARLGIEQLDLWQVHRPDLLAHPAEVAATLDHMVSSGKVRAVGISNHTPAQTRALLKHLTAPLASTQPEFSALTLDSMTDGTLDLACGADIAVMAWSPLGGGRIVQPETPREVAVAAALDVIAQAQDVSRAAAAISWIMVHPARPIPIVGSQAPARIADAADAINVRWTRSEWYDVLVASRGAPMP